MGDVRSECFVLSFPFPFSFFLFFSGVFLLDYGAGNVLSVINAIKSQGCDVTIISDPSQIPSASKLIFPGVGSFGACVKALETKGFIEPLKQFIASGKPLLGVCLGMQLLFEESEESPGVKGLGIIPGKITKYEFLLKFCGMFFFFVFNPFWFWQVCSWEGAIRASYGLEWSHGGEGVAGADAGF